MSNNNLKNKFEKMKELHDQGMFCSKIALELGCSKRSVIRILNEGGVNTSLDRKVYIDAEELIQLYNKGVHLQDIADKFNCSRPTINRILRENNVTSRKKDFDSIREEVVKVYDNEKKGIELIGKRFDVSARFVKNMVDKYSKMRRSEDYQFDINKDYFKKIDSRNKAYILGFMYADGNVAKDHHHFSISLTATDDEVLYKIKDEISYSGNLRYTKRDHTKRKYKTKPECTLRINRKDMCQDLENLGCMPNKTWKVRFPSEDIVPIEFQADFCRGYWDGDGHISKKERTLAVIGNQFFILGMLDRLPLKETPRLYYKQSSKFIDDPDKKTILCYIGVKHGCLDVFNYLYGNCQNTLYLKRKYELAHRWMST